MVKRAGLPITLSPACPGSWRQVRSGFTWLIADGARCRRGQALARCSFSFLATPPKPAWPDLQDSLQVVVSANCDGIVRHAQGSSLGGWGDLHESLNYEAGEVIGGIIPEAHDTLQGSFCLMINNRRMTSLAEDREGLWSGWHYRQRIWRLGAEPPPRTLLALGICELTHVLRGADRAYSEVLCGFADPVQLVTRDDVPVVTSARVALEQLTRTREEDDMIWQDLQSGLVASGYGLSPDDWMVAGCFGKMLTDRVIVEGYPVLSAQGVSLSAPADCVIMSMLAENAIQLRHKRLGYHMPMHAWVFHRLPDAFRQWVRAAFEQVKISFDELERDYISLCQRLRNSGRRLCILNTIASDRSESIQRYAHFTGALEERFASVRNLSLNLLAERLAATEGLLVIDVDAMAVELGIRSQSHDRVHHGPLLERRIRNDLALQAALCW